MFNHQIGRDKEDQKLKQGCSSPTIMLDKQKKAEVVQKQQEGSAITPKSTASYCLLCLDEAPDMLNRSLFCRSGDTSDDCSCCLSCLKGYIASTICSAFKGSVPALHCPLCPPAKEKGEGNRCLLNFSFLMDLAQQTPDLQDSLHRYNDLASSVGTMQCGACHCRNSIHIVPTEANVASSKTQLGENFSAVKSVIQSYDCGTIGVENVFEQVSTKLFPHLNVLSDQEAWHSIILNILRLISNPERRVNFQLRFHLMMSVI
jgi:hypothetical protein